MTKNVSSQTTADLQAKGKYYYDKFKTAMKDAKKTDFMPNGTCRNGVKGNVSVFVAKDGTTIYRNDMEDGSVSYSMNLKDANGKLKALELKDHDNDGNIDTMSAIGYGNFDVTGDVEEFLDRNDDGTFDMAVIYSDFNKSYKDSKPVKIRQDGNPEPISFIDRCIDKLKSLF